MSAAKRVRNGLVKLLQWLVIAMVILLVLDVIWGVFTRFVMGSPLAHQLLQGKVPDSWLGQASYTDELACVLLVWISMIGGALAFGEKMHLGVDFFVGLMHPTSRKTLAIIVQLLTIALAVVVFLVGGWSLAMSQMSQELPTMRWLSRGEVYLVLPLAGLFIILFATESLVEIYRKPAEVCDDAQQEGGK
ncbi:MAG: TRAP transporter small permease [Kiritimatiellae bacterium]|nr:TRAP transporter small permease [Kiritimatiellia bacterium]